MSTLHPNDVFESHHPHIVDVRSPDEFRQEHIPGSRNIPMEQLGTHATSLAEGPVILSCRSGRRAAEAKALLQQYGCTDVAVLEGGLQGWKAAGKNTNKLPGVRFSIMQQVQITAGSLILLGFFIKPLWFLVPVVGSGLLLAGLSNTCMMAVLLSRMPWNHQRVTTCSPASTEGTHT